MTPRLGLLLTLLVTPTGRAWESECRPAAEASTWGGRFADPSASICAEADAPVCGPGLDGARGVQLGEHVWLARTALVQAGLGDLRSTTLPDAWGTGLPVPGGTTASVAPGPLSNLSRRVSRGTTLPELAQVPDVSHTFSDWLLGNEHCFVPGLPATTPADVVDCHRFDPHMGAVNSTHFPPQAQAMYGRYHAAAVTVARRCRALEAAFDGSEHPLAADEGRTTVADCEKEAMALEVVASHYLADAWSSGHMWQRWGPPTGRSDPQERLNLSAVAVVSGIVHGWRSVVRDYLDVTDLQHDALCMAGPFDEGDPVVRAHLVGRSDATPVGGDLYLLACNAYDGDREQAVATGAGLRPQYDRMIACLAAGLGEVYREGPETFGAATPLTSLDAAITSSTQPECWGARVTNASFELGMGLSDVFTLADPGVGARTVLSLALGDQGGSLERLGVTPSNVERARRQLRAELARMGLHVRRRAARAPDATDLADLDHPAVRKLLGFERNAASAPDGATFTPWVPYLDPAEPRSWYDDPFGACVTDADCAVAVGPGTWCDRGGPEGGRCARPEAALPRSFRRAEIAYWCSRASTQDLDTVRSTCAAGTSADACDACVEVILPHLRNGCSAGSWALLQEEDDVDRRSLCDVLADASVPGAYEAAPVYALHGPGDASGARAAVRALCEATPAERPLNPADDAWWLPTAEPARIALTTGDPSADVVLRSVGAGPPAPWTLSWSDPSLEASPTTFDLAGATPRTVTLTATSTTSRLVEVEVTSACAPSRPTSVLAEIGDGVVHVSFDDVGSFEPLIDTRYRDVGLLLSSSTQVVGVRGDDSIGDGAICGAPNGSFCDGDVTLTFVDPVSSVSLYVGDREQDTTNPFTLEVRSPGGSVIDTRSAWQDRRFYGFGSGPIGSIHFTSSVDAELVDELTFVLAP